MKKIQVQIREVFGVKRVYPLTEEGRLLLSLTGMRSFNQTHMDTLKKIGYEIEVVPLTFNDDKSAA